MNKIVIILFLIVGQQQFLFSQSINRHNLNKLLTFCDSTKADEILIVHKEEIVIHWHRTDFSKLQVDTTLARCGNPYMPTASMVKSWVGLLIGILIDKGLINSIDDYVCKYLPEWQIGCQNNITVKHLLTMTGGFKRLGARGVLSQSNMNKFVLTLKPDTLPDIRFSYSNESVQLLGILIERVTKLKGDEAFNKYILEPLEMDSTSFSKDSVGNIIFYGGCTTTVRSAYKVGQLMLNKGKWKGKQIISEHWVKESTTSSKLAPYYGYLWWIDRNSIHWNYAAIGDLGRMTIVFPELDLVFIRNQSCDLSPSSLNMSWMGPQFLDLIYNILNE